MTIEPDTCEALGASPKHPVKNGQSQSKTVLFSQAAPFIAAVLVLPAIVLAAYGSTFFQAGFVDPWVYTGLAHNYDDVVDRVGPTYYAARIAHIYPTMFFEHFLGDRLGFFGLRYCMLAACGMAVFEFGRRLYSPSVGLAGAAIAVCSPWLLEEFSSDLYAGTACTYLLLAYIFAFIPSRQKLISHALAGIFVGLACQTSQLTIGVFATAFPAWLIVNRRQPFPQQALYVTIGIVAFVGTYALLLFALGFTNSRWGEGDPTFGIIKQLLAGEAARWAEPLSVVFSDEYYYAFAPALVAGFLLAITVGNWNSAELPKQRALAYAVVSLLPLAFYLWRVFEHHGVLTKTFTVVYLLPSGLLTSVVLFGECTNRLRARTRAISMIVVSLAMMASWIHSTPPILDWLDQIDAASFFVFVGVLGAAMLVAAVSRQRIATTIVTAAAVMFVFTAPYQNKEFKYLRMPLAAGIDGWDIRRGAQELMDVVQATSKPNEGAIGFWYPNASLPLNSIQAAYMWEYTRAFPTTSEGLPKLDSATSARMEQFSRIVLLAENDAELQLGYEALSKFETSNRSQLQDLGSGEFRGTTWGYHYRVVKFIDEVPPDPKTSDSTIGWLDIATMVSQPYWSPAKTDHIGGKAHITSFPGSGGYSAQIDLPEAVRLSGRGVVRIWIHVTAGEFNISAIAWGDSSTVLREPLLVRSSEKEKLIELDLAELSIPTSLLFANASGSGPSAAVVRAIEISTP